MKTKINLLWMLALAFVLAGVTVAAWTSAQSEEPAALACDPVTDPPGGPDPDPSDQMPSDLVFRG